MKIKILLFISLLFLFLAFFASNLGLYLDDATFALPVKAGTSVEYGLGYLKNFSFFRALALPYYFLVYSLFLQYGGIAHLIPLFLYAIFLKLVYQVLNLQGLNSKVAAVVTVLIATIPFWPEVYGWFAASNALIAYILFFIQLNIVIKKPDLVSSWFWLFLLQLGIVFLYDTVFFMPLSLSYLWLEKSKKKSIWMKSYLMRVIFLMLPAIGYLSYRVIFPPVVSTRIKIVPLGQILQNWSNYLDNFKTLFSGEFFHGFWLERLNVGASIIKDSWITIVLFVAMLLVMYQLFQNKQDTVYSPISDDKKKVKIFWLMSFVLSLIPISLQEYYLSFRLLVIPLSCLLFWLVFCAVEASSRWRKRTGDFIRAVIIPVFAVSIMFQVGLLDGYKQIYKDDLFTIKQINDLHTQQGYSFNNQATIYLHNYPVNASNIYSYGDYGVSVFKYNWSAQYFNSLEFVNWQEFVIDSENESWFSSSYSKEESQRIEPLLMIEYSNNCQKRVCLQVNE